MKREKMKQKRRRRKAKVMFSFFAEVMYFRFFVGDDDYCRTIQVAAEAEYGAPILTVSNIVAYPSDQDINTTVLNNADSFDYSEAVIWVCPNANEYYDRGTYSVAVTAGNPTAFVLEVIASSQTLPIPEPPVRINCSDVPSEEFIWGPRSVCVEDSNTTDVFVVSADCSLNLSFVFLIFSPFESE